MGGEVVKLDASSFQIQSLAWSTSSSTLFVGAEVNVFSESVAKLGGGRGRTEYCPPPQHISACSLGSSMIMIVNRFS